MKIKVTFTVLLIIGTLAQAMEETEIKQTTESNYKKLKEMLVEGSGILSLKLLAAWQVAQADPLTKEQAPEEIFELVNKLKDIQTCEDSLQKEKRFFLNLIINPEIDIEKHFQKLIKKHVKDGFVKNIFKEKPINRYQLLNSILLSSIIKRKAIPSIRLALFCGADANIKDSKLGDAALTWALCHHPDIEIVRLLIGTNANINITNKDGETPLMVLASRGLGARMQFLLNANADTSIQDDQGMTALMMAISFGNEEMVQVLLEKDKNINVKNSQGQTPLICAVQSRRHTSTVKGLLDNGANPDCQDNDGDTALMWAIRYNRKEKIQILLDHGADIKIKNNDGNTALMVAEKNYTDEAIVQMLKEAENKQF